MATSMFEKFTNGISHQFHDASDRMVDFKDDAARSFDRRVSKLGRMMKEHPLIAIGLGVGVGAGVGYLIARISHRG
jgi:ElaB/YqjD/DUF883 family membrane-anchored ribosome-binding protein